MGTMEPDRSEALDRAEPEAENRDNLIIVFGWVPLDQRLKL
jgi:hypothetical protein